MGEQSGWSMPLHYGDWAAEVRHVRSRAGVLDVSDTGRIRIRGDGGLELLERTCTADVARQEDDTIIETLLCNEQGGIVAAGRLVRLSSFWVLTCDAQCRRSALELLQATADGFDAKVDDQTFKTAKLAVTGPAAASLLDGVLPERISGLGPMAARLGSLMIAKYIAARTNFTGEWGVEVMIPQNFSAQAWRFITHKAGSSVISPAGATAREVLRIEAALPRYGSEIDQTIDPISAGMEEAVNFDGDFIGAQAVRQARQRGPIRRRVGLLLGQTSGDGADAFPLRRGAAVRTTGGQEAGSITSAAYSPTLGQTIAMAYVTPELADRRDDLLVDAASDSGAEAPVAGRIVALPFYKA